MLRNTTNGGEKKFFRLIIKINLNKKGDFYMPIKGIQVTATAQKVPGWYKFHRTKPISTASIDSTMYVSPFYEGSFTYRFRKFIGRFLNTKPNGFQAELQKELFEFDLSKLN